MNPLEGKTRAKCAQNEQRSRHPIQNHTVAKAMRYAGFAKGSCKPPCRGSAQRDVFPARAGRPCARVLRGKERWAQAFLDNPEGRRDEMEANCGPRAARSREAAREINFDAGIHARESGSTDLLHLPRRARGLLRGGKPQLFLPLLSTVIRFAAAPCTFPPYIRLPSPSPSSS